MDRISAEEDIRLIREIMEQSARYTSFSGISGVIAGTLSLIGCVFSCWITYNIDFSKQMTWYILTWVIIFVASIGQDFYQAQRKARRHGQTFFSAPTYQMIKAVLPGVLVGFIISLKALFLNEIDAIPAIWAIGYGVALCAAGMFTVREVRIFGVLQIITGTIGLFFFSTLPSSFYLLAISMGAYHILFGLWMTRKYGW